MEELIRFKSRIDTLREDEFIVFIKLYKPRYLSNIFFQYFKNELIKTNDIEEWRNNIVPNINTMTNKIDNIINSRDDDDEDIEDIDGKNKNININLDNLPSDLISLISSFLNFKDTLYFEKTNRSILIGTRSPISIKTLSSSYFTKCIEYSNINECMYNFYRFRKLKEVNINIGDIMTEFYDYNEYNDEYIEKSYCFINDLHQLPIWNNLEILSLENDETALYQKEMQFISTLNITKLCNITTFKWHGDCFYDDDVFTKDIFKNLKFLYLDSNEIVLDRVDKMFDFSKLNGLSIIPNGNDYQPIISRTCHGLQSFHGVQDKQNGLYLNEINKFQKLKELCLISSAIFNKQTINIFLSQNLNDLQRIYWDISKIKNVINDYHESIKGLLSIKSLKYLSIKTNTFQQIMMIFEILRNALKNQFKSWIKIRIIRKQQNQFSDQDTNIRQSILNLVYCLESISNHFMLICDIKNIGSYFMYHNNKYLIKYIDENRLIISNKQCRINGYHQQWIMNCNHCK